MKRQRFIIWSSLLVSMAASVAFNVLGTALVTRSPIAIVMAFLWPVLATLAVEIMCKVRFPKGTLWNVARFGGVGMVALISMVTSYSHTFHVLMSWNQGLLIAITGPLAIDGMMTLTGAALLALSTPRRTTRKTPAKRPAAHRPARKLAAA